MRLLLPVGRSGWAIAAGYLGLFSVLVVPAPLALLCGILGWRNIKKSQDSAKPKHGLGRCVFGIVAGGIGTALLITLVAIYLWGPDS